MSPSTEPTKVPLPHNNGGVSAVTLLQSPSMPLLLFTSNTVPAAADPNMLKLSPRRLHAAVVVAIVEHAVPVELPLPLGQ